MEYTVYTKARQATATKSFDHLEDAIKYCKTHKTKYGHIVQAPYEWYEDGKKHSMHKVFYED